MLLNKMQLLDKEELLEALTNNGYGEIADILTDKNVNGESFMNLNLSQMINWKLPPATIKTVNDFINKVKRNPAIPVKNEKVSPYQVKKQKLPHPLPIFPKNNLFNNPPEEELKNTSLFACSNRNDYKKKLETLLASPTTSQPKTVTSALKDLRPLPAQTNLKLTPSTFDKVNNLEFKPVEYGYILPNEVDRAKNTLANCLNSKGIIKPSNEPNVLLETREYLELDIQNPFPVPQRRKIEMSGKTKGKYENHVIEAKVSASQYAVNKFYKNRPLPPIPQEEDNNFIPVDEPETKPNRNLDGCQNFPKNIQNLNEVKEKIDEKVNLKNERFYRNTDRKGAKELLKNLPDGAFLFRPSQIYFLALTVKFKGTFYNLGIEKTASQTLKLNADMDTCSPEFRTLQAFTDHFSREAVTFKNNGDLVEIYLKPVLPLNVF